MLALLVWAPLGLASTGWAQPRDPDGQLELLDDGRPAHSASASDPSRSTRDATGAAEGFHASTRLRPGNELLLVIPDPQPRESTVVVDEEGRIAVGRYGRVQVAGLTETEATASLRTYLRRYIVNTSAISLVRTDDRFFVFVTGRVTTAGFVRVRPSATVWEAVQAAGTGEGADLRRVTLARGGREQIIDVQAYLTRETREPLPTVDLGDHLFVPSVGAYNTGDQGRGVLLARKSLANKLFVLGAVRSPGIYDRAEEMDPLTAISLAGGPAPNADLSSVRLLTSHRSQHLDLLAFMLGGSMPPFELPEGQGAILYVPEQTAGNEAHPLALSVTVMGGVVRPGRVAVRGPTRLLEVIGLAGGPQTQGDLTEVVVVQSGPGFTLSAEYDVKDFLSDGGDVAQVIVNPGDVVYVGISMFDTWTTIVRLISDVAIISAALIFFIGVNQ